jgi:hypothetical protein
MRRLVLAALLLAAADAAAQVKVQIEPARDGPPQLVQPQPFPGPGPGIGMPIPGFGFQPRTVKVDGDTLIYEVPVTKFVTREVEQKIKVGDKEETRKVLVPEIVTEMTQAKMALKDVKAFGADGKPLDADALKKRLAKPTVVLVSPMPGPLPKEWAQLLKDDALVVHLPPNFPLPDIKPPDFKLPPPPPPPPDVKQIQPPPPPDEP